MERKTALEVKKALVTFDEIAADCTQGKMTSHQRLLLYVDKYGESTFVKMYTRAQLHKLCLAYSAQFQTRASKADVGKLLVPVMKQSTSMVYPFYLDNLRTEANVDEVNQRVSIRIIRSR